MKQIITLFMSLSLLLISSVGWGQYTGTGTFTKITSIDDLTDGYYVVAEANDEYAMNNIHNGTFLDRTAIAPTADELTDPDATIVWKIETNGGGRSIYNEGIEKFVSYTGSSNNVQIVDAVTADNQRWTITYGSSVFSFANLDNPARVLQYNASAPRFACYTSNQRKFNLYKMEEAGGPIPPSISNITQTPAADITSTTTVAVTADVTAGDAAIDKVELHWNTDNDFDDFTTINMSSIPRATTFETDSDIPAQANGTTVYYRIYAEDEDEESRTSDVQSYTVRDAATTTLPYEEDFSSGEFGDIYTYTVAGTNPWEIDSGGAQANGWQGENPEEHWMVLPGIDFDAYSMEQMTFTTYARHGTIDENNYLKLFYSPDYAGIGDPATATWTELAFDQPAPGAVGGSEIETASGVIDLSGLAGENVYLAFKYYSTDSPTSWRVDDISIYENKFVTFYFKGPGWMNNDPHDPEIWGPFNGWSGAETMTFDAVLDWWNVTVDVGDASAEFTYQTRFSENGVTKFQKATDNFSADPTFTTTTGEIWIDASNNTSFSWDENDFYLPADKITETQPPLSEPDNHVTDFTATANSESSITVNWTDSDAANYLIKGSTVSYEDIDDPVDGIAEANALLVYNVGATIQNHTFTALDPNTTYYFKAFPYNGTGALTNYKTDGEVPEASATTLSGPLYYHTGFEADNSTHLSGATGYDPGVYELNGLEWEIGPEALIGSAAGDMKFGSRSARLRLDGGIYGSITMIEDKPNGIGSITFVYARSNFSGDRTGVAPSFVVEYMLDGAKTWVQAGAEISLEGIDELTRFKAIVNADGNARVRIRQTAGDSGKRWNIDKIVISDYNSVSYLADMSLATGFDPETDVVYMAGTVFGVWQEPGTNPEAMMDRLGLSPLFLKAMPAAGGEKNGSLEYKYFVNAGWGGGEWPDAPNRMITPNDGSIIDDLFSYVTFSGSGPVSVPANWDATAVPSFRNVLVRGDADVDADVVVKPFTVEGLIIEQDASIAVEPLQSLTVNGTLTNIAGNSGLGILSDATGTGSLIHNSDNVDATIQRYINGGGYHLVSVPLTGGATAGLFMHSYLYEFDAVAQEWVIESETPEDPIDSDKGYMIWYTGANTTFSFSGGLNNGLFEPQINSAAAVELFNLVPNPYPSAMDWDAAGGWTKDNLVNAVYIWNRQAADVENPNGQWASYINGASTNDGSRYIPVGQSFFVETDGLGAPDLAMNNDVRVHSDQAFFKNQQEIPDMLRIHAQTENGTDEMVVRLHSDATDAFDSQFDASKIYGSSALPQLYSISSDDRRLSINSLPLAEDATVVPVALEWDVNGEVTLAFTNIHSFEPTVKLFIEDQLTGQMIDLREQDSYTFMHSESNNAQRFMLHLYDVVSVDEIEAPSTHRIWNHHDRMYVSIPAHAGERATIELFDLLGKKLLETDLKLEDPVSLHMPATGIVVVRVTTGNEVFTNKLFIR